MLILMRRKDETLVIQDGDDVVEINILGVFGNQVRLGIDAPQHVQVDRKEVYLRKKGEQQ